MHVGTTIKVEKIDGDIVNTTSGRFKVGNKPHEHKNDRHPDLTVGSILVVEKPNPTSFYVYVYEGCGCRFLIYPQSD